LNNSAYCGGGIHIYDNSSPTLTNNTISHNLAYYCGGGIDIYDNSSPSLTSNIISNNSADEYGGGISISDSSSPSLTSNTISNDSAYWGGGIFIGWCSSPILTDNTILNNSAYYGSGIYIYDNSSPILTSNIISNNSANYGGGIYIRDSSSPSLTNNIISDNSADEHGGGIRIYDNSSPILTSNTISNNSANYGGGISISDSSFPTLTNNTISDNIAFYRGGGIFISWYSSPILTSNTILNNLTNYGGGISIKDYSSPSLTNNTISNNGAFCCGGGISIWHSSPSLTSNTISNNSAQLGGGIYIWDHSSPSLTNNTISNNLADHGGGIYIYWYSSVNLVKCAIGMNKSYYKGGAIYDTLCSKVVIDSSFIVDNGDRANHGSGLAYITSDADSGVTFKIAQSHIYYNAFQSDTEIYNLSSVTIPLENNFWWDTTDAEISSKIYGPNDHEPWVNDFIGGVPGEPVSIDSIRNYDKDFATVVDSIGGEDTLYIRVYGQDRNNHIREIAVVIIRSSVYPEGIACGLVETDTNSGIYQGVAYVRESTGNDTIRVDDIEQTIRVNSTGDTISLLGNIDTTKKFCIKYKGGPVGMQEVLPKVFAASVSPNLFRDFTVIKYQMPQKGRVILKILDITGRVVNTLVDEIKEPGYYSVVWRGKDTNGRDLPSGIYFYAIEAGKNRVFGKIIRLK